jgi:hypothetical protein
MVPAEDDADTDTRWCQMTSAGPELLDPETLSQDELVAACWRAGNLSWKLDPHQLRVYDRICNWVDNPPDSVELGALYDSVYVVDIGRRWGKTALCLIMLYEWAIRRPGSILTYATAEKQQIKSIIIPLHRKLSWGAPADICPVYHGSSEGMEQGLYLPNGSIIKLVGVDKDPDRLRGQGSDGAVFSEAAHMKELAESVSGILLPQFQRRPWARLILESTAPVDLDHDFDEVFIPDAQLRGAYSFGTIDDNEAITAEEKSKAIRESGGINSHRTQREYYGKRVRDPVRVVVPEWDETRHVQDWPAPAYAHCYVSADPGTRDLFGILWGYWDFGRAALYIQRDWAAPNTLTRTAAAAIRAGEQELWGAPDPAGEPVDPLALRGTRAPGAGPDVQTVKAWHPHTGAPEGVLSYYDHTTKMLHANPYQRVSDIDLRLCLDLSQDYGLAFEAIRKLHTLEAMLSSFRDAVSNGSFIAHPRCVRLIGHMNNARWNEKRTDIDRTAQFGHFDLMMCAVYMWLKVSGNRHLNPNAPYRPQAVPGVEIMDSLPWQRAQDPNARTLDVMRDLMGLPDSGRRRVPGQIRMQRR